MFSRWTQLRLSAKFGLIGVGLIGLYTLAGFVILPLIAEAVLPDKLSQRLNRPVRLDNI